jgi:hypothetical protein
MSCQSVFPFEMMEEVIQKVKVIALVHCPLPFFSRKTGEKF